MQFEILLAEQYNVSAQHAIIIITSIQQAAFIQLYSLLDLKVPQCFCISFEASCESYGGFVKSNTQEPFCKKKNKSNISKIAALTFLATGFLQTTGYEIRG